MSSPQSVTRVIHILEALSASAEPVSLAQLSRRLDAPKSSVAALLRGLAQADFVVPADGAYRLGPRAFGLGSALVESRRRLQSSDLIRAGMRQLAERSGETVLFAVGDVETDTLTYVDAIESRQPVRFIAAVGDRRPLYCTAGGRVLLAQIPETQLRAYFRKLRPGALTPHTELDKRVLAGLVEQARQRGIAQTLDQAADGAAGTAAVVRDAGAVLGALIVAAPSSRLREQSEELASLVRSQAELISQSLGAPKPAR